MGEIFSQIITNTESVDVALGLDVTLSNQIEIWATMSISSVAVIYFAHLLASLRAAFIALFGKSENSNNNNNNIPPPSYRRDYEDNNNNKSFIQRLRNLVISMIFILPIIFTIIRAPAVLVSSLIVTELFLQAQVRITRASIISIGLAQGILDSYQSIGKEISSGISNDVESYE